MTADNDRQNSGSKRIRRSGEGTCGLSLQRKLSGECTAHKGQSRVEIRDGAGRAMSAVVGRVEVRPPPPRSLRLWLPASLLAHGRLSAFALRDSARPRTLPLGHTARGEDFIYREPHGDGDDDGDDDADGRNPVQVSI